MRAVSQSLKAVILAVTVMSAASTVEAAGPPRVLASIAPIGGLAASVMHGVATPTVLLPAGASPHAYTMKPSDARALASADLILWVGDAMETFLEEPLAKLSRPKNVVELIETEGLTLYPTRTGGVWEDDHGHDHGKSHGHGHSHGHDHGAVDAHIWLDPQNAMVLVDRIAAELAARDPGHADAYRANAASTKAALADLDRELAATLKPVGDRPYVVFHDAYQYLEQRYELFPIGSVTVAAERAPGAKRLAKLRDEITGRGAACVFREPQFTPKILESLAADTKVRVGVLDPLGADIPAGPDGYPTLMRRLAASLSGCLKAGG